MSSLYNSNWLHLNSQCDCWLQKANEAKFLHGGCVLDCLTIIDWLWLNPCYLARTEKSATESSEASGNNECLIWLVTFRILLWDDFLGLSKIWTVIIVVHVCNAMRTHDNFFTVSPRSFSSSDLVSDWIWVESEVSISMTNVKFKFNSNLKVNSETTSNTWSNLHSQDFKTTTNRPFAIHRYLSSAEVLCRSLFTSDCASCTSFLQEACQAGTAIACI